MPNEQNAQQRGESYKKYDQERTKHEVLTILVLVSASRLL